MLNARPDAVGASGQSTSCCRILGWVVGGEASGFEGWGFGGEGSLAAGVLSPRLHQQLQVPHL